MINSDFNKCVKIKETKRGYEVKCRLGLWSVNAKALADAHREASHYFMQYKASGEYHSIIGGPSPIDVMVKKGMIR